MNQQEQIAHLAAALQEVGKMPEWCWQSPQWRWVAESDDPRVAYSNSTVILAALCGVAYSYCAKHRIEVYPINNKWCFGVSEEFDTEIEALAAAVRIATKG